MRKVKIKTAKAEKDAYGNYSISVPDFAYIINAQFMNNECLCTYVEEPEIKKSASIRAVKS